MRAVAHSPRPPELAVPMESGASGGARRVYDELSAAQADSASCVRARAYLDACLAQAATLPSDLPAQASDLPGWADARTERVGRQYQAYLADRKAGAPRRYFTSRGQALHFLRAVAPTKLVDGAWLYGVLAHWDDPRFFPLVRIYLEELGEGVAARNHVVLYRSLLADNGCDQWEDLDDDHFAQGAIQLALAYHAPRFLPEIIGFNLGYEQLPLHLLITAYELDELGIDPHYFSLHVTIDNAGTGHARRALDAVRLAMPAGDAADEFYRRIRNGYLLNDIGKGSQAVIDSFDLEGELVAILQRKSVFGRHAHSDYCKVAGRPVGEWLSEPRLIPEFLAVLERSGWIRRHRDPAQSRFWQLLQGDRAEMFGVFNEYELQILHEWIAGPALTQAGLQPVAPALAAGGLAGPAQAASRLTFRARKKLLKDLDANRCAATSGADFPTARQYEDSGQEGDDFDADTRGIEAMQARLPTHRERMAALLPWLAPQLHWRPEGLLATRLFAEGFAACR